MGAAGVTEFAEAAAPGWASLQLLGLSGCAPGDTGAAALARAGAAGAWPALRALLLDGGDVGPAGVGALGRGGAAGAWPGLLLLDLGNNPLGDEGVSALVRKAAGWLGAHFTQHGGGGGGAWPALRQLRLPAALLLPEGVAALADGAPAVWPRLEDLDLSDNLLLGEEGASALALGRAGLEDSAAAGGGPGGAAGAQSASAAPAVKWPALKTLQLRRAGLAGGAAGTLVAGGAAWPSLETLVLSGNDLDDAAVATLAARAAGALPQMRRLVAARDSARLGPLVSHVGAAALAAAAGFSELIELDLSGHCAGAAGAQAIASAGRRWRALRTLCLDDNLIGDAGAAAIAGAIAEGAWRELRCLRLRGCDVGDEGAAALVEAGAGCPWLQVRGRWVPQPRPGSAAHLRRRTCILASPARVPLFSSLETLNRCSASLAAGPTPTDCSAHRSWTCLTTRSAPPACSRSRAAGAAGRSSAC